MGEKCKNLNFVTEYFDDIPAFIVLLKGPEHVYDYANNLYKSVSKKTDIIGRTVREVFPELEGRGLFEMLDDVYRTGVPLKMDEIKVEYDIHNTGTTEHMYFSFYCKPLINDEGSTEGIFVHAYDITKPVNAKISAEQNKNYLQNIIIHAPVATGIYTGKDMMIEFANEKMLALWGKDKSVIGKKLSDALPELIGQPFFPLLDEVFTTGITYHTNEQKALLERGNELKLFWFNFSYKPLMDKHNNVYAILNMALDITDQVEAKAKLIQAEEKLLSAIEVANLGTWEYNSITKEVKMNETLREWRGVKLKGPLTMDDIPPGISEKDLFRRQIKKALKTGDSHINMEYDVVHPETKETKRLHAQGKIFFNEDNEPEFITGITHDITSQRLNEALLEKNISAKTTELAAVNDDLRRLNINLEQFVYIASHDLQEPLRKINIFSDMLQKSNASLTDDSKAYLNKIEKAAQRMSILINDLLEFSKVSSTEKTFVATDLNKILNDIKVDYEVLIKQKNAEITIDSLPVIEAIPLQMNQLFYNLIGNALKFAKADAPPEIKISCKMLSPEEIESMKLNANLSYCNIAVKDNGIGFDQKYALQIFEMLQRLHGKHEYAGTGIGLSLAKKIAENHSGLITASSAENQGAVFNVILPVRRK